MTDRGQFISGQGLKSTWLFPTSVKVQQSAHGSFESVRDHLRFLSELRRGNGWMPFRHGYLCTDGTWQIRFWGWDYSVRVRLVRQ